MGISYLSGRPFPVTGNSLIDSTTNGYKWYFPAGVSQVLNWSVSSSVWNHPSLQTTSIQNNFARAFGNIAEFIDVKFNFLGYFSGSGGRLGYENARLQGSDMNITFAYEGTSTTGVFLSDRKFSSTSATAFCYFPDADNDSFYYLGAPGDTWLNYNNPFIKGLTFIQGTNGFTLLTHELLHGLGLKHPHDDGGTGRPTYKSLGIQFEDRQWITIMSYDKFENGGDGAYTGSMPIGPMIYDAIALQYLYGESNFNAGNTSYDLSQYIGNYFNCQWDASGIDTLNGANLSFGVVVDLGLTTETNGWATHYIGFVTTKTDYLNLADKGVNPQKWTWLWGEYENAFGTNFSDVLSGNALNNDINGGDGDDYMEGREGNDRFDWDGASRGGNDTMVGGLGNDTYVLNSTGDKVIEESGEGVDTVWVSFSFSLNGLPFVENLSGFGSSGISLTGNVGRNVISGTSGSDLIDGLGGVDTALFIGPRKDYVLGVVAPSGSFAVEDKVAARDGRDTLVNMERLSFSDVKVAMDMGGNAGQVVKILGAVFGASAVANKTYVGIGLSYLDTGMTYTDLMQLAIDARLGGRGSNTDVVNLLYTNVVGSAPDSSTLAYYKGLLDSGAFTQGSLGVLAADTSINTTNINLVGLTQTGVEFL